MSNFACEICGATQVDSTQGYIEGCVHYVSTIGGDHEVEFGDGEWVDAVTDGVTWAYSYESIAASLQRHPCRSRRNPSRHRTTRSRTLELPRPMQRVGCDCKAEGGIGFRFVRPRKTIGFDWMESER